MAGTPASCGDGRCTVVRAIELSFQRYAGTYSALPELRDTLEVIARDLRVLGGAAMSDAADLVRQILDGTAA